MNEADALEQTDRHTHTQAHNSLRLAHRYDTIQREFLKQKVNFLCIARAPLTIILLFFHAPN